MTIRVTDIEPLERITTVKQEVSKGDIYMVDFRYHDDRAANTRSPLISKVRPAVVIGDDYILHGGNVWVAPITHTSSYCNKDDNIVIQLDNDEPSYVSLSNFSSMPLILLTHYKGRLSNKTMEAIDQIMLKRGGLTKYIERYTQVIDQQQSRISELEHDIAELQSCIDELMKAMKGKTVHDINPHSQIDKFNAKLLKSVEIRLSNRGHNVPIIDLNDIPADVDAPTAKVKKESRNIRKYTGLRIKEVDTWGKAKVNNFIKKCENKDVTVASICKSYNISSSSRFYKIKDAVYERAKQLN